MRGKLTPIRITVVILSAILFISIVLLLKTLHDRLLVTIPAQGGAITVGEIGSPKTTNPLLATTETEKALSSILYAGLTKKTVSGEIIPELAETYEVSPDGKTYTFTLQAATFHNKKKVTSEDVLFTYAKIKEGLAGPVLATYFGPVTLETPDTKTITFILPESRSDFLEKTTMGILPMSIWSTIPNDTFSSSPYTLRGIGAGSFKVQSITYKNNIPATITLKRNKHYVLGKPLLKKVSISFFANQNDLWKAINSNKVDITADVTPETISTKKISSKKKITAVPTNTTASLYLLKNASGILSDSSFIKVLDTIIDKKKIISIVENEYGETAETPIISEDIQTHIKTFGYTLSDQGVLLKNGKTLGFSIATINDPLTSKLVQTFANELRLLGITVSVQSFDPGFFNTELANRNFSAILMRGTKGTNTAYKEIFSLYKATTPFITSKRVYSVVPEELTSPKNYYANIHEWYTNTDNVYSIFIKNN